MRLCRLKDIEERKEIVSVVFQRLGDRLAHCLECCKMYDSVNPELRKKPVDGIIVAAVDLFKRDIVFPGYLLDPFETCKVTVGKIVGYNDIITGLDKFHCHMAADVSGTTGNQNSFFHILQFKMFVAQCPRAVIRPLSKSFKFIKYPCKIIKYIQNDFTNFVSGAHPAVRTRDIRHPRQAGMPDELPCI